MNRRFLYRLPFFTFLFFLENIVTAQTASVERVVSSLATPSSESVSSKSTNKKSKVAAATFEIATSTKDESISVLRYQKRLASSHNGCVIELMQSELPLRRTEPIFEQFGNVQYDKLVSGIYSYCIVTEFGSRQALADYVEKVIRPRAPQAKIVEYRNGERQ